MTFLPNLESVVNKYGERLTDLSIMLHFQYEFVMVLSSVFGNDVCERTERYKCLCVVGLANLACLGKSLSVSTLHGPMDTWKAASFLRRYELNNSLICSTRQDFIEIEHILDTEYDALARKTLTGVGSCFANTTVVGRTFKGYLFSLGEVDAYIKSEDRRRG